MFGRKLNENVTKEIERRKRALDRNGYYNDFGGSVGSYAIDGVPEYNLSEMMQKTTYSRLISPMYTTPSGNIHEIKGRMLASTAISKDGTAIDPTKHYENEYWNTTGDKRGYVPPPGITSIRTAYAGEGATINTIKEADITLRLFSLDQYNLIVPYFVRIGTILYLEYGWSNPKIELERHFAYPREFLKTEENDDGVPIVTMNLDAVQVFPDEFAINTRGNSDIFVGTVTNYDAKMQQDGGFEINLSLKTTGHSMYNLPTYSDSRANIKLVKNTTDANDDPFAHNLDERNSTIMLAKSKLIIQEDFNIVDVFKTNFTLSGWKTDDLTGFEQPSFYYAKDSAGGRKDIINMRGKLSEKNFHVHPGIKSGNWDSGMDLVAVHNSGDLIITVTQISNQKLTLGEMTEGKKNEGKTTEATYFGYKINYYPSMRYIEDNLLSRFFGIVKDDGKVTAGIRSIHIPKAAFEIGLDKVVLPYKSNRMLTHKLLVPKNFRQVLINTEAMSAMLQRTGTGQFKSEGEIMPPGKKKSKSGYHHQNYAAFSKTLGIMLKKHGLEFLDETKSAIAPAEADESPTNPNHLPASMRHMYVNIELVQESFLGSENINFCNRNYFPSTGDTMSVKGGDGKVRVMKRNQLLDRDDLTADEIYSYFQDVGVRFNKDACAKTLREGLYNMWNDISSNFHNFPNFEVGANINLPNFLQVYDLRYTKADEYYEFDVFNKDSIIRSLEFNSMVPSTVQLAATLGASTSFDFDSLLGGTNNGLKEDLLTDINKNQGITKKTNNILNAISFEKSNYLETLVNYQSGDVKSLLDAVAAKSDTTGVSTEAKLPPKTTTELSQILGYSLPKAVGTAVVPVGPPAPEEASEEVTKIVDVPTLELMGLNVNDIILQKGEASSYAFYGVSPELIAGSKAAVEEDNRDKDEVVRKFYPNLNQNFAEMSDVLNKLFLLNNKGEALYGIANEGAEEQTSENKIKRKVQRDDGSIGDEEVSPSINLATGKVTGLVKSSKHLKFTTTYANFTDSIPGQRGATLIDFGTHSDYQAYLDYLIYQDESQSLQALNGTISYFELTFEIDGISGILPGEAFTISYLPDLIKDYFYFVVKNVEQTCSSDGWTTTITALQRRKYFVSKDRKTLPIALSNVDEPKEIKPIVGKLPYEPQQIVPLPEQAEYDPLAELPPDLEPTDADQTSRESPPGGYSNLTPPERPNIPVPSHGGEDIADDQTPDALDFSDDAFTLDTKGWKEAPPIPNPNFVPYDIADSPTAEITLAYTDGQAQLITTPGPDEQQLVKIYPKGDKNTAPIAFTLGVTDILSDKEYNQIKHRYNSAFGGKAHSQTITDVLSQQYERITIKDRNFDDRFNADGTPKDTDFGKWDTRAVVNFYVARRDISEGFSVKDYIGQMMEESTVIGNDTSKRENSSAKSTETQSYVDDIIYRILQQPQRTRLNVLEIQEEDVDKKEDIQESETIDTIPIEPEVVDTLGALPETAAADPEPDENQEEEEKEPVPVEPFLSTYQSYKLSKAWKGPAWEQNAKVLYALCGGWGTKGAGFVKTQIFYDEASKESSVPFYTRQKFWDEMIQQPNRGGVYDKEAAMARMAELKETGEFTNMTPNQTWVPEYKMPDGYDPVNVRKQSKKFYERFQDSGEVFTVDE